MTVFIINKDINFYNIINNTGISIFHNDFTFYVYVKI